MANNVNIVPQFMSYDTEEVERLLHEVENRSFLEGIPEAISENRDMIEASYGHSRIQNGRLQFFHSRKDEEDYDAGDTSKLLHEDDISAAFIPSVRIASQDAVIQGNACVAYGGDTVRFTATVSNTGGAPHFRLWDGDVLVEESNGVATANGISLNCNTGVMTIPSLQENVSVGVSAFVAGIAESEKITVTAKPLVLMEGFTVSGTKTFTETGSSTLVLVPDNDEYTVAVASIEAVLSYNGSSGRSDEYLSVSPFSLQDLQIMATVTGIPETTREYTLLVTATDVKGHVYTKTETLTIQSIPVSSFAISGDDVISETGTYAYAIGSILPANYNRGIASLAASINNSQGSGITASANGLSGATLTISSLPETTTEIILTITATLEGGGSVSATKSVSIKVVPAGFVDLGLPSGLLWARGNITKDAQENYVIGEPTEVGYYFSWGNTEGHVTANGRTFTDGYKFTNDEYYPDTPGCKLTGDIASNDAEHDAVLAALGVPYRMPTKGEYEELIANCNAEYVQVDGRNGIRLTSRLNGNSIFFPAGGWANGSNEIVKHNEFANYWSSTFSKIDSNSHVFGYGFHGATSGEVRISGEDHGSQGYNMRAVV